MKTTAVEWLQVQIKNCPTAENLMNNIDGFLMEAKEIEKQQIIDAWYDGQNDFEREVEMYAFGEEYYNGIIKSEENGK